MPASQFTLNKVLPLLLGSAAIFVAILLAAFLVEKLTPGLRKNLPPCEQTRPLGFALFTDAVVWSVPITLMTLVIAQVAQHLSGWLGLQLPDQSLVLIMRANDTPVETRWAIAVFATVEAPLVEEGIFRRFLFRNLLRNRFLTPMGAMCISGVIFALMHFNIVTFLPLGFIGAALAWSYYKTGRLIVPMTIHFLFNLTNLLLMLLFPEMK